MFVRRQQVRFQHCDPASMVFYPRYLEMVHATVEDWFGEVVGMSFSDMHDALKLSVPVLSLAMEFTAPSRLGDELDLTVSVEHLGTTSLQLLINARCNCSARFMARLKLVQISMDDYRPRPWSADIRSALDKR
ncbi:TPA: acyl-CoA thioesterase [Pseudomonas aeruginosa]|uniref:acyl-CoA thioesterase n=1 Tax=Pseudomonas aeruginosa group TaxID=136841 RepID=UPI0018C56924|nr:MULTISPECIES: thioesterase family protein [Pseudomonas aeruginosa group]MBH9459221.1 acyl-CoA thioesterase [Pseudomonas aeruginosa]MBH9465938.1 acyl-CoA thioesterase [Pseudomonas aeruginosa]QPZ62122.1 acyl-CoA thioesterase [Pseudomonas aeruginosa]HCF0987716.1 acyl-CoA thioesterase [Pseudomonas aeruginosa]HCF9525542.1 acyl-CoA thioesterase [Pseudomonas aeruginosa]